MPFASFLYLDRFSQIILPQKERASLGINMCVCVCVGQQVCVYTHTSFTLLEKQRLATRSAYGDRKPDSSFSHPMPTWKKKLKWGVYSQLNYYNIMYVNITTVVNQFYRIKKFTSKGLKWLTLQIYSNWFL